MSDGNFGTDPGQPGTYPQAGWQPLPPVQYPQPGTYGHPMSPQFQQDYAVPMPAARRTNSLAIAALCCGIGSYVAGPLASIPAIILGAMSLKQIRETGEDGHGMAVAGLILGVVGTLLFVLAVILFVAFADFAIHQVNNFPPPVPKNP